VRTDEMANRVDNDTRERFINTWYIYTVSGKKRGQSILVITLTNLDTVS